MELSKFSAACRALHARVHIYSDPGPHGQHHVYIVRDIIRNALCCRQEILGYDRDADIAVAMLRALRRTGVELPEDTERDSGAYRCASEHPADRKVSAG